jgi:hypothetical protein
MYNMQEKALEYIKHALDKANQKGAYTLSEAANIINALEELNKFINPDKLEDHGKEEN